MASSDGSDIINVDDFKSIEVTVHMTNETSRTQVMPGSRAYGSKVVDEPGTDVRFVEFLEEGMALQISRRSCEVGHTLQLEIEVTGTKMDLQFSAVTRVSQLEHLDEEWDRVEVALLKYDDNQWNAIQSIYQNRQNEITDFFFRAKG